MANSANTTRAGVDARQRALGRLGFVHLYLAAGLASTVAGLMLRCGGTGAAGVLESYTLSVAWHEMKTEAAKLGMTPYQYQRSVTP